jgi:hypothetical protein
MANCPYLEIIITVPTNPEHELKLRTQLTDDTLCRMIQGPSKKSTKCPVCQDTLGFMMMCQICRLDNDVITP